MPVNITDAALVTVVTLHAIGHAPRMYVPAAPASARARLPAVPARPACPCQPGATHAPRNKLMDPRSRRARAGALGTKCTVSLTKAADGSSNLALSRVLLYDVKGELLPSSVLSTSASSRSGASGGCVDASNATACATDAAADAAAAAKASYIEVRARAVRARV